MAMPAGWPRRMRLPVICAPMYHVTTPDLVIAALRAGVAAALPRANLPDFAAFEAALARIRSSIADAPVRPPFAVNLSTRLAPAEMDAHLQACRRHGVELIISATGDPTALIARARDHRLLVFCDAVNLRFADKAIAAGADGIIAIGHGGGGHSGTVNHLTLLAAIRRRFQGTVVMAGAIANGAAVRAAEILGADFAYLGTRFIATHESGAPAPYKAMLVEAGARDLVYTAGVNGVPANWLRPSLAQHGLDADRLPAPEPGTHGHGHLPAGAVPWQNLWSAGQGIEEIDDILAVADLVARLECEYRAACSVPTFFS